MTQPTCEAISAEADAAWDRYFEDRSIANRNRLVEIYLPFVRSTAKRIMGRLPRCASIRLHELVSAGCEGLMHSISRFEPGQSQFLTFARLRIPGAILDYLRSIDVLPRSQRQKQKLDPTHNPLRILSLEKKDVSEDPPPPIFIEDFWREWTRDLKQKDRLIVVNYFRLQKTMKEIGREVGLSEASISKRLQHAIEFMRQKRIPNEL